MNTVIRKRGNSLAVRLPASAVNVARLERDQKVQVTAEDGRIIIEPVGRVEYLLDDLLAGITRKNSPPEISVGAPVGRENL